MKRKPGLRIRALLNHEVLHMSCFLGDAVEAELVNHPYIQDHPELLTIAETAAKTLADLYQAIGAKEDAFHDRHLRT